MISTLSGTRFYYMTVTTIVMLTAFVVAPTYLILLYRNIKRKIRQRSDYLHTHRNYDIWK